MTAESYIKTQDHLTVSFNDGETVTVYPSNPNYQKIIDALNVRDYELARRFAIPVAAVKDKIRRVNKRGVGTVKLTAGVVYYNDQPIHSTLTDRIVAMANEGFDIEPMCMFLANLKANPSFRAVNELYGFLEKGNLPITEDGYFLAYKRVRGDYTDIHTGKFDNSIGTVVEMVRNEVNEDPNQTCSAGLHFCSRDYLPNFGTGAGSRTVILKINPADVVAIPTDYNNTKGRTCRYEVIGELEHSKEAPLEGTFHPSENYQAPADEDVSDDEDWDDEDEDFEFDEDFSEVGTLDPNVLPPVDGADMILHDTLHGIVDDVSKEPLKPMTEGIEALLPNTETVVRSFVDIKAAAKWACTPPSSIRRVLNGDRKTTAGYGWREAIVETDGLNDLREHGTLKNGRPHGTNE